MEQPDLPSASTGASIARLHFDCPAMRPLALVCLLATTLLVACDNSPPPQKPAPLPAPLEEPAPAKPVVEAAQTPAVLPKPGKKVIVDETLPEPAEAKPKPAEKVSPHEKLPPAKLDLHLPPEVIEQLTPTEPVEEVTEQALLPEMFVDKPTQPSPFELNGRLITNDHEKSDNYWDSVEGAELQFKFRR